MSGTKDMQHVAEALFEYANNKTTFQTDKIVSVPASAYTDPDQWQAEIDSIFKRTPLCLATSAELKGPNSFKAMEAVGLPVLITRAKDGKVRAFLNVCAHRGANVAENGCGIAARFACKYHGWTYSNEGALMGVAEQQTFGDIDKSQHGLRELTCEERGGLIFVCLTPELDFELDKFTAGMLDDLDAVEFADWTYLGKREIEGANWKIAFDGYLEGYHFAQLHPETIHPRTISNLTHYEAFGPHMRIGFAQTDIKSILGNAPKEKWGEMENTGFDFVRILFPFRREGPKDDADKEALEGMMDFLKTVVLEEDYAIGEQIQKGLESGAHSHIVLGQNERGNQYFHEWIDWYLRDDESMPTPSL